MRIFLLLPVLLPFLLSPLYLLGCMKKTRVLKAFTYALVLLVSASVFIGCFLCGGETLTLVKLTNTVSLTLGADGLTKLFGVIIAVLWPITTLYAFDYLAEDDKKQRFFAFFLLSYGAACGVAFAGNLVTLYLFFELLTLCTLPLVMHAMDDRARYAGKKYLLYSVFGASLGLIAVVFLASYGVCDAGFALGGTLNADLIAGKENQLRAAFVLAFFGFGVKAALLPMSGWLPSASVAPTPVTALLHAVAVVKAGAFACMRLTYYAFGTALLVNTAAQTIPMCAAILTILYGSWRALRTNHLKRRLAYSTISNLSYILFGVLLMSNGGLLAASKHMLYHAFTKITLFFCVGAVLERTKKEYLDEIEGLGRRMPITFACFAAASVSLMGVPPLPGFFSKWALGVSAAQSGTALGYIGLGALLFSAVLTALYCMQVVTRAFFPTRNPMLASDGAGRIETRGMTSAIVLTCVFLVLLGLCNGLVQTVLQTWLLGGGI